MYYIDFHLILSGKYITNLKKIEFHNFWFRRKYR